jgi:hypothetical protein
MKKWADYLISAVAYDPENLISVATRHQDADLGVTKGEPVDRLKIVSDIQNGLSYITIYSGKNSWKKGHKLRTFSIEDNQYIRIDKNKVKLDYLGDLSESLYEKLNPVLEPEPSQPSSTRGSLPKESAEELPQELDLVPEPENFHQKFTQLNYLQQQIAELKNMISDELLLTSQFEVVHDVDKSFKIDKLVKDVEGSESNEIQHEIIETLREQNKKLDDVEKKLHNSKK